MIYAIANANASHLIFSFLTHVSSDYLFLFSTLPLDMLQYINPLQIALLLLAVTTAKEFISEEKGKNVELQSFTTNSPESISAIFKSGGFLFNISSCVQDEAPSTLWKAGDGEAGNVVSLISFIGLEDRIVKIELPLVLSKLVIPKKYLFGRKIPGDYFLNIIQEEAMPFLQITYIHVHVLPLKFKLRHVGTLRNSR